LLFKIYTPPHFLFPSFLPLFPSLFFPPPTPSPYTTYTFSNPDPPILLNPATLYFNIFYASFFESALPCTPYYSFILLAICLSSTKHDLYSPKSA